MKDNSIAIVVALVALVVSGFGLFTGGDTAQFGAAETTTFTNPITFEENVTMQNETLKVGSDSAALNVIYFGAVDGCMAIQATASDTLATTATSSSFCNS